MKKKFSYCIDIIEYILFFIAIALNLFLIILLT